MIIMKINRLTEFSEAVRLSTVKRLRAVPPGFENWRISKNAMSFGDILHHLIECDDWLLDKLRGKTLEPISGKKGEGEVSDRSEYSALIEKLVNTGKARCEYIRHLTEEDLNENIYDGRFGSEVSTWWIIMRGNLDHEIHHRGQISTYLRVIRDMHGPDE